MFVLCTHLLFFFRCRVKLWKFLSVHNQLYSLISVRSFHWKSKISKLQSVEFSLTALRSILLSGEMVMDEELLVLSQKTQVQTQHHVRLTATCDSSSRGSHTLPWPPWVPAHTQAVWEGKHSSNSFVRDSSGIWIQTHDIPKLQMFILCALLEFQ